MLVFFTAARFTEKGLFNWYAAYIVRSKCGVAVCSALQMNMMIFQLVNTLLLYVTLNGTGSCKGVPAHF